MTRRLLALDTTTEACSVAAGEDGVAASRWQRLPQGQSRHLLPLINEVLAELGWARADLDAIACCRGPGSFTGVRISTGVAQGLALGLDRPVIPVSTLATLAHGGFAQEAVDHVLAAIDARKGEVYWACFRWGANGPEPMGDEAVTSPSAVELPVGGGHWAGVGTGFGAYPELLAERLQHRVVIEGDALPDARELWQIARRLWDADQVSRPADAVPVYLRNQVADPPKPTP